MKNIITFALVFLIVPFISKAQPYIDLSLGAGLNKPKVGDYRGVGFNKAGIAFKGDIEAYYMFNSNIGLGTGIGFTYQKGFWTKYSHDRSSYSINIPLNMVYHFNTLPVEILFGTIVNFALEKSYKPVFGNTVEDFKDVFLSIQFGAFYRFTDRIKIGVFAETGINHYFEDTFLNVVALQKPPTNKYYIRNILIKINYTLLRK